MIGYIVVFQAFTYRRDVFKSYRTLQIVGTVYNIHSYKVSIIGIASCVKCTFDFLYIICYDINWHAYTVLRGDIAIQRRCINDLKFHNNDFITGRNLTADTVRKFNLRTLFQLMLSGN